MSNAFYRIDNPRDRQYKNVYINLDDISAVQYPNESLQVGIVTMKTGKELYIQREDLDGILACLDLVNTPDKQFVFEPDIPDDLLERIGLRGVAK